MDSPADLSRLEYLEQQLEELHEAIDLAERGKRPNLNAAIAYQKQATTVRQQLDEERARLEQEEAAAAAADRAADLTPEELEEALAELMVEWSDQLLERAVAIYSDRHEMDPDWQPRSERLEQDAARE